MWRATHTRSRQEPDNQTNSALSPASPCTVFPPRRSRPHCRPAGGGHEGRRRGQEHVRGKRGHRKEGKRGREKGKTNQQGCLFFCTVLCEGERRRNGRGRRKEGTGKGGSKREEGLRKGMEGDGKSASVQFIHLLVFFFFFFLTTKDDRLKDWKRETEEAVT